ncbi:MAG: LD-carboxypeptidase [Bacteroidia bacterium]|nr:LD-carboxypeptidase [Bacteroidia bacterium]
MRNKLILILAVAAATSCGRAVRPQPLQKGDRVAIVATSYWMPDSTVSKACDCLREFGLEAVVMENVHLQTPVSDTVNRSYYAGTPAQRADGLLRALKDDSVKAVICARGGYGAIQMLQELDLRELRRHPKWIVGYSDVTALHLACVKAGVMSIHGNMASSLAAGGLEEEGNREMLEVLMGKRPCYEIQASPYNVEGEASGVLVGGNMITMMTLLGSDYDCIADRDCILFIEEVEESMHAIDRLFNMLSLQGKMKHIKGIVFGEFTDCGTEFAYGSVEEMLSAYTSGLGIPVAFGFQAGHGDLNLPLVEGAPATLTVSGRNAILAQ